MPTGYAKHFRPQQTPQSEKMRDDQVENSAGGYVWAVDGWTRLDRFLVLGSEGNTYYATERKITRENAASVVQLIKEDGERVVRRVVEISHAGRAYKNDAALFVLALCFAEGDAATKTAAVDALPKVARIGTHLFTFLEYANALRGWGRVLKRAVANWYEAKDVDGLAYDLTKYRERNGWSHRDALRLAHPHTHDEAKNWLYRYAVGKIDGDLTDASAYIAAVENVKTAKAKDAAEYVRTYGLPREVLPTEVLNDPLVWEALLEKMPMTAMIRNLATMTRIGTIKPLAKQTGEVVTRLTDKERLRKGRIHPIQCLAALLTYTSGRGARGGHEWQPVSQVSDALDRSFYLSFDAVEPTGKRVVLALDVSGSMGSGVVGGVPNLSPRVASAALALVTAAVEPNHTFVAFTSGSSRTQWAGYGAAITTLDISPRERLDDVVRKVSNLPFGGTDCALPMIWATENNIQADAFVILTDSETWAGNVHPKQALDRYRQKFNIPARLVVVGMVSNGFTIADPNDRGMLDVVGFSTDTPTVISDFIRE